MISQELPMQSAIRPSTTAKLAFLYEHPQWFAALFAELTRRRVPYEKIFIPQHFYEVGAAPPAFKVLFNRMSPSADSRQHGSGIFHTLAYLEHLERNGVRVLNGAQAFRHEISKASQASLLKSLGLRFIPTRVIHSADQAVAAAAGLRYPIVVKPNIGGSGKGVTRFDSSRDLADAVAAGRLDLGYDHIALVQEFVPARGGFITRVETLGGNYLYGIKVHLSGETFDLCPADICQTPTGQALQNACAVEASKAGLQVEGFRPTTEIIGNIERIVRAAGIDVGGIEFLVDDRDGQVYYYDINALSNFVADAPRVIGFDPVQNLADFVEKELRDAR
jgi:glutathione synthase/RimK-type ligase-like ATP-grasp enzyme